MNGMPNNASRRRAAKKAQQEQRRAGLRGLHLNEPLHVTADYKPPAAQGGVWTATLTAEGLTPRTVTGRGAHATYHAALDLLDDLTEEIDRDLATVSMLDGDTTAFARLATTEGFNGCTSTRPEAQQVTRTMLLPPGMR